MPAMCMKSSRRRVLLAAGLLFLGAASQGAPAAPEMLRIDRLIAAVANQKDAKFVRNGTAYDAPDAARFLRGKLDSMGSRINTASEFIEQIASRSSTSGKAYTIHFADGRKQPAAEFLKEELRRMDDATAR